MGWTVAIQPQVVSAGGTPPPIGRLSRKSSATVGGTQCILVGGLQLTGAAKGEEDRDRTEISASLPPQLRGQRRDSVISGDTPTLSGAIAL